MTDYHDKQFEFQHEKSLLDIMNYTVLDIEIYRVTICHTQPEPSQTIIWSPNLTKNLNDIKI